MGASLHKRACSLLHTHPFQYLPWPSIFMHINSQQKHSSSLFSVNIIYIFFGCNLWQLTFHNQLDPLPQKLTFNFCLFLFQAPVLQGVIQESSVRPIFRLFHAPNVCALDFGIKFRYHFTLYLFYNFRVPQPCVQYIQDPKMVSSCHIAPCRFKISPCIPGALLQAGWLSPIYYMKNLISGKINAFSFQSSQQSFFSWCPTEVIRFSLPGIFRAMFWIHSNTTFAGIPEGLGSKSDLTRPKFHKLS